MEKNNVGSERTKTVAEELERWFDSECRVELGNGTPEAFRRK